VSVQSVESQWNLRVKVLGILYEYLDLTADPLADEMRIFDGMAFYDLTALGDELGLEVDVSLPLLRSKQ